MTTNLVIGFGIFLPGALLVILSTLMLLKYDLDLEQVWLPFMIGAGAPWCSVWRSSCSPSTGPARTADSVSTWRFRERAWAKRVSAQSRYCATSVSKNANRKTGLGIIYSGRFFFVRTRERDDAWMASSGAGKRAGALSVRR